MIETEAYPDRPYCHRINTWYVAGDKVTVGPAYRGNGEYVSDGHCGPFTVVERLGAARDYKVCRGDVVGPWDLIINASRLTRR